MTGWAREEGLDALGFFVVKPAAAGLGGRPGEHVVMCQGLPDAAIAAWRLLQAVGPVMYIFINTFEIVSHIYSHYFSNSHLFSTIYFASIGC